MCTGLEIAAIVGAAGTLAGAGSAIKRSTKGPPPLPAPAAPPPPVPPAPAPPPPAALDAGEGEAVSKDKKRRATRYSIADTLLVSPLGGASSASAPGRTLLGG